MDDLAGQTHGRLTFLRAETRRKWICRCRCGTVKSFDKYNVLKGASPSCGCIHIQNNRARKTHGMSRTITYRAWAGMIKRCEDTNCEDYKNYGGRGIRVDPSWRNDFAAFLLAVGAKPSRAHSIDRIDNNGNYEPGNCRWATRAEQSSNTRRNNMIVWD